MKLQHHIPQLLLRLALGLSFLSAVADRFGYWGKPGDADVAWGNWHNFANYTAQLIAFLPQSLVNIFAIAATALELILALMLIIGFKIRVAAISSAILLACFGLCMTLSLGIKPPMDYSVWTAATAALLLSSLSDFKYSIDNKFKKQL